MTTSRSAAAASYGRPAFWKVPGSGYESPPPRQSHLRAPPLPPPILPPPGRRRSSSGLKKRVRFADEANVGVSP
ncbi:hypothetical protein KR067_008992, partial [Drosophila pandora]